MLRSFAYDIFYQHPIRPELQRNLFGVLLVAQEKLAQKLNNEPYITLDHLSQKQMDDALDKHITFQLMLAAEVKAVYKRRVIRELFALVTSFTEDSPELDVIIKVLAQFDSIKVSQPKTGSDNVTPLFPAPLNALGEEWQTYIFPDFNYKNVSDDEYKEICTYLAKAFAKAAVYDNRNVLDIESFKYENLPKKLRDSIKNVDKYQYHYDLLVAKNAAYAKTANEGALGILKDMSRFEESKIVLSGYTSFYEMVDKLTLHISNPKPALKRNVKQHYSNLEFYLFMMSRKQDLLSDLEHIM